MSGQPATDPDLAPINARLEVVHDLVQRISDEVGPRTFVGADGIIERHRPEVYTAMEAVGMAAYEFVQSQPSPERLAAAQDLVTGKLREISLTSPITFHYESLGINALIRLEKAG